MVIKPDEKEKHNYTGEKFLSNFALCGILNPT
jgi:hypothetical protein